MISAKNIEENNRTAKNRDLFKETGDTKGIFHAKMDTIKDRNGKDLTEAEDIKKKWQEYTEELYKKGLNDLDNHNGVITHLEPDILEWEVIWTLGSIITNKANGGDGILAEIFQILKDNAVKVLHSLCQQIWKAQQYPQDWKKLVFIPMPKKGNAKKCSNCHTATQAIVPSSKVMLKILQARLQQYMNQELLGVQLSPCILSPYLFNFYAEYIMWNARLDNLQARIKTARRSINNFQYADDSTLLAESEEKLKSLLMKVKEESGKAGLNLNIQKTKIFCKSIINYPSVKN